MSHVELVWDNFAKKSLKTAPILIRSNIKKLGDVK